MEKPGIRPISPSHVFVESLTCYRGWIGSVSYVPPKRFIPAIWSVEVIRRPDWLSASLRAAKLGKPFACVQIQTPSGDFVALYQALVGAFGAAVWSDPKHPKPSGHLEMVTYNCGEVLVANSGVAPSYDWWKLNA
jgi:hypothetical protein